MRATGAGCCWVQNLTLVTDKFGVHTDGANSISNKETNAGQENNGTNLLRSMRATGVQWTMYVTRVNHSHYSMGNQGIYLAVYSFYRHSAYD